MGFSKPVSKDTGRAAGFSLIEVSVVVVISLVVGAVAIPNMVSVISNSRLHAGVTSMSGLLQNCHMEAVKKNITLTAHFGTIDGQALVAWVKPAAGSPDRLPTDRQTQWEAPVMMMTTPSGAGAPTAISTTMLGFTPQTNEPSFNSRGMPCVFDDGNCTNAGFLYYFKDTSRPGSQGWAALSITPAGRIKKWFWTGSSWVD